MSLSREEIDGWMKWLDDSLDESRQRARLRREAMEQGQTGGTGGDLSQRLELALQNRRPTNGKRSLG